MTCVFYVKEVFAPVPDADLAAEKEVVEGEDAPPAEEEEKKEPNLVSKEDTVSML